MQTRGTFPALYDGRSKRSHKKQASISGTFTVARRPRTVASGPTSMRARRAMSHAKAYRGPR